MPKVGEKEFPYTPEGVQAAAEESSQSGIPVSDAGSRNESYQLGGLIPGQPGFGQRPPLPGTSLYEEGGEVKQTIYEKNQAKRDKIAARRKKSVASSKERREARKARRKERREGRKERREARKDKREGVVETVKTKGGDYKVYKKESKKAKSFQTAFAEAKGKDFTWDGRKYSGKTKEQAAAAKAKKTAKKVKPKPFVIKGETAKEKEAYDKLKEDVVSGVSEDKIIGIVKPQK